MHLTQFLTMEITAACNLGKEHEGACPNLHPDRFAGVDTSRPLTESIMVETAVAFYREHNFKGAVAFHYYCEPLLVKDKMLRVMAAIKAQVPEARFCLWSNGLLIPEEPEACTFLKKFDFIWITNYHRDNFSRVQKLVPKTKILYWQLDGRKQPEGRESTAPCGRMFSEFIVDHYGRLHICCIDWAGRVEVGNLWDDNLAYLVEKWQDIRSQIAGSSMDPDAPEACLKCSCRHAKVATLIPEIAKAGSRANKGRPGENIRRQQRHRHQQALKASRLFAIAGVCAPSGNNQEWKAGASQVADICEVFETYKQADKWLQASDAYFIAAMPTTKHLAGPVKEALEIHKNENWLTVEGHSQEGEARRGIVITQRGASKGFTPGGTPITRRLVKKVSIRLNELEVICTEPPLQQQTAVTFTHYGIPESRLTEHFIWNDQAYRSAGARVFVVTDREYLVPPYARCLIYPEKMEHFQLSATSNYGIRYAIDSGFNRVIKTDTDIVFDEDTWLDLLKVTDGHCGLPVYHMSDNYEERAEKFVLAPNATGTISMTASDWNQAHFHEGCIGYGCDDGILRKEIARRHIREDRSGKVFHIAHIPGTPQKEFNKSEPRIDHWNRDTGFNHENFAENRKHHRRPDLKPTWGMAGFGDLTVVIVHYRMPLQRLDDFISWNGELFEKHGVRLIVISDVERLHLPPWCRVAVYPLELEMFSLAKTSNYGIRLAGQGIICKSDPDCVFSDNVLQQMLSVTPTAGVSPEYFMADSFEKKEQARYSWQASKGTLCLHWHHWCKISGYDERSEGYGIEDGDAFHRAGQLEGHSVKRLKHNFWHIAHSSSKQVKGHMRKDCWNRKEGFNPRNHRANVKAMNQGPWNSIFWGMPGAC